MKRISFPAVVVALLIQALPLTVFGGVATEESPPSGSPAPQNKSSEDPGPAAALKPPPLELNLSGARKAFGKSFRLARVEGGFRLEGVTTEECYSKTEFLVLGNDLKILTTPECADLAQAPGSARIKLSRKAQELDFSSLNAKERVCLVTEDPDLDGPEALHCDKLYVGDKEIQEQRAAEERERREKLSSAAEAVIVNCARSDQLDDVLQALDPEILSLAQDMDEDKLNRVYDSALSKATKKSVLENSEKHQAASEVIDRVRERTKGKDEKILKAKMVIAEKAIFQDADLSEEERLSLLEEQVELLREADLEVDEKLIDRFEAAAKQRIVTARLEREVPQAKKEGLEAIMKGDLKSFQNAQDKLFKAHKDLGCKADASEQRPECVGIAQLSKQLSLTGMQLGQVKNLSSQCEMQQKVNPNAKCEQYNQLLSQMKQNSMFQELGIQLPEHQEVAVPEEKKNGLYTPKAPGTTNAVTNSAQPGSNVNGFTLDVSGDDPTRNFMNRNQSSVQNPRNGQIQPNSAGNLTRNPYQNRPAPTYRRTLMRR